MSSTAELDSSNSFLSFANLVRVTHNGTCFLQCLQAHLEMPMSQLVDQFVALGKRPYVKGEVRDWCDCFANNYAVYAADSKKTRMLPSESFVTSDVLLEFARAMNFSILLLTTHPERRHGVTIMDLFEPQVPEKEALVVIIHVDGQKFDYFIPKPDKEKQFWNFVEAAITVSLFMPLCQYYSTHRIFAFVGYPQRQVWPRLRCYS